MTTSGAQRRHRAFVVANGEPEFILLQMQKRDERFAD
jgi:hypothetical protein